jgi:hypothetical protein
LALGFWIVFESGAWASYAKEAAHTHAVGSAKLGHANPHGAIAKSVSSPNSAGSSKSAGAGAHSAFKPAGMLAKMEHQLEGEVAELKRLENALENLLDCGQNGNPSSGSGSPGSSSGFSPNSSQTASPAMTSQRDRHRRHHWRGHMGRGMELARLMYQMQREEQTLQHLEQNLEKQLAGLKHLERSLHHLNDAGHVGHQTGLAQWKSETGNHSNSRAAGVRIWNHSSTNGAGQTHAGNLTSAPTSPSSSSSSSHAFTGNSHALSGARGVGSKISSQQHRSAVHHH